MIFCAEKALGRVALNTSDTSVINASVVGNVMPMRIKAYTGLGADKSHVNVTMRLRHTQYNV